MKCPMCDGEGSFQDDVLWKGIGGGPTEDCEFCLGNGEVSFRRRCLWFFECEIPEFIRITKHKWVMWRISLIRKDRI